MLYDFVFDKLFPRMLIQIILCNYMICNYLVKGSKSNAHSFDGLADLHLVVRDVLACYTSRLQRMRTRVFGSLS